MDTYDLTKYIFSHKHVLKNNHFRNKKLIIDGTGLYHTLYFTAGFDQTHGGEYEEFESVVCHFFKNLRECLIKPYVVLDGGDDASDKNFPTRKNRAEIRVKKAQALSVGRPRNVLPILVKDVFKQILRKLEVPFVQCMTKADWETAALANEWNCPVLSNKNEFFIFNIKGGFLPLSRFQWNNQDVVKQSDKKFIPAKEFLADRLCTRLNLNTEHLLPFFATVLGIQADLDTSMFPFWAKYSVGSTESKHMDGLLRWLSHFKEPEDAISGLLSYIKDPKHSDVLLKALTEGLEEYRLTPSSLPQFFSSGEPLPCLVLNLPVWTLQHLANGKLSPIILDVLVKQRTILSSSVENSHLCSSNLTSQPIRQTIYGLLLTKGPGEVEEYDRQGLTLTSSRVAAVQPSCSTPNLHLETLWETSWNWRQQVFLDALGASQAPDRLHVPPTLQLAVYVTCYWLKHAQPEPEPELLGALLVGLVFGELSRDPVTQRGAVPKRLKNLKNHKEWMPLDLDVAHSFSQWQSSLRDVICLSQVLANPVPEPEYAWLYSGTLLHSVTRELKKGVSPEALLAGFPHALQLYQQLREAVELELDEEMKMRVRTRRGRQIKPTEPEGHAAESTVSTRRKNSKSRNPDDEVYEQTCSIRTRQKNRARKSDPKSKKSEHSRWE